MTLSCSVLFTFNVKFQIKELDKVAYCEGEDGSWSERKDECVLKF